MQLQIRNPDGTAVGASKASGAQGTLVAAVALNSATMRYAANDYATGAIGAGNVASAVTYSVAYN